MLFPDVEQRYKYKHTPLIEVVCQIRYPTILRIGAQDPVDFQEKVQPEFPNFRELPSLTVQVPEEVAQFLHPQLVSSAGGSVKAYEFRSSNGEWAINLTRDFLALTNSEYSMWEDFRNKLKIPYTALMDCYKPITFNRVGLRYRNVIRRSEIGLENVPWAELVNPVLVGFLGISQSHAVEDVSGSTLLKLDDNLGNVRLAYGLVRYEKTREICFLIDSDFYLEATGEIKNGFKLIDEFNRRNRNLFRWCISDRLHRSLEPEAIS